MSLLLRIGAYAIRPYKFMLDFLFPASCLGCKREGSFLCSLCVQKIRINPFQVCPVCKKQSLRGRTHDGRCGSKTPLSGLIIAAKYTTNPVLEKTIRQFKYHYSTELMKELGMILFEALRKNYTATFDSIIVPIPLHPSRKRWRGFNQAELLAREVGSLSGIAVVDLLKRKKKTAQQARLSREERLENVKGAFETGDSSFPKAPADGQLSAIPPSPRLWWTGDDQHNHPAKQGGGVRILLVDDVASTLATLEEAAKVLRQAGFEDITGLVLARG